MPIRIPRGWEIPESRVTPEALVLGRRRGLALGAGLLAAPATALAQGAPPALPPAMRNTRYAPGRDITDEREATSFNNFYEFGSHKTISRAAQRLPQRPWTVKVEGMVESPREFGIEDLLRFMPLEERVYRLRCVEAWSMVVPWTGFPLSALLDAVRPLGSARYVVFETAAIPAVMPGLRQSWYPWPYIEGCTIEEAANELSFMVVGAYGKPLPPQNGGPIRFHQPWKYGFKAGKSIVRITLTDRRPVSFWERVQPQEYGFWANVNPEVPHPRWSQASERVLGTNARVPTQIFNGYGEFVAALYTGLRNERLWA
ncbi:protein-methionine-sulfoxide reductase catalytic subunit MsrP [Roseomonas alkaliterrae]|uniref:Protein-methionine-sulfoxide reductase catalytic subunit MsrP n=1 Tax=Neoroseomonas alkaliterrae TaxID=1452450 RepID=A0A840XWK6_9PROT|nr:protein-methionine-sulfoxide reductase catalytic subunit MsrP [Neoroseomonas alkaliterrae]MBB5691009.1 sulfoxide reductase catalytic subunit YedY [Neoroseomonas alkaliterrae]MBR0675833.1 protein-methionine-sulfoxide reductase catalytic subunit MsrP [Neoroseomonas alkaliterrae]